MTTLTIETIQKYIDEAEKLGACQESITVLRSLTTLEEFLNHYNVSNWIIWVANNIIKGRWKEAESIILSSPQYAYNYTANVIEDRWSEAEEIILTSPEYSYWYSKYVVGGRWEEGEKIILTSPEYSYLYAYYVLHRRWKEAEPIIASDKDIVNEYIHIIAVIDDSSDIDEVVENIYRLQLQS